MSWPKVKLGDCCEVVSGATPKTGNPDYWGGEIPWVSPKSLSKLETKFLDEPTEYITQAGFDSCSTRMLPAMSLLLSCRAPVGLTAINREPICTNQGFKSLVPNPEIIDVNYLFQIMRKMRPVLEAKGRGATFTEVSKAIVERFEIPLPPLNEQRRIADILDKADEIKKSTKKEMVLRNDFVASTFLEMFGDPFLNEKGLKIVSFESLTNRITYGFTKPMKHLSEGIPILTGKNVRNGWIDYDNVHYAEHDEYHALTAKSKPEKNDILITKDGSIGRTALFNVDFPVCINQSVALVKPKHEVVNPNYLVAYLNSNPVQRKIQNMGKGGALKHLQITELAKFPVVLPDIKNQNKFVEISEKVRLIVNVQEISETNVKSLAQELLS